MCLRKGNPLLCVFIEPELLVGIIKSKLQLKWKIFFSVKRFSIFEGFQNIGAGALRNTIDPQPKHWKISLI